METTYGFRFWRFSASLQPDDLKRCVGKNAVAAARSVYTSEYLIINVNYPRNI
jgi:hypothetical protein